MKAQTQIGMIGSGWGVFLTCIVAVWFGIVLCAWELVVQPVEIEETMRHPNAPGKIVFVKSQEDPTPDWDVKIGSMIDGRAHGGLFLTGGDLNTFLKRSIRSADGRLDARFHNRIAGQEFVLGVMFYTPWRKEPISVQAFGGFEKGNLGYYYAPRRMYIGALPLPEPVARELTGALFLKMFDGPKLGTLTDSWRGIQDIQLRDRRMFLRWE